MQALIVNLCGSSAGNFLLTAVAITPGGVGVTEGGAVIVLIAFGTDPARALAGTVLFSLFTQVMEVPLGALDFLGWGFSKNGTH